MTSHFTAELDLILFQNKGVSSPAADSVTPIVVRLPTVLAATCIPELDAIYDCLVEMLARIDIASTKQDIVQKLLNLNSADYIDLSQAAIYWQDQIVLAARVKKSQGTCPDVSEVAGTYDIILNEVFPAAIEAVSTVDFDTTFGGGANEAIYNALQRSMAAGVRLIAIILDAPTTDDIFDIAFFQ